MPYSDRMQEVLKLVEETGDRVVVLPEDREPFVLMGIDSYRALLKTAAGKQNLANLSERELLDRINQQIAEWREQREAELSEYDLSQFQVDQKKEPKEPVEEPEVSPVSGESERVHSVEKTLAVPHDSVDLPVVEDESHEEYRLEPLA